LTKLRLFDEGLFIDMQGDRKTVQASLKAKKQREDLITNKMLLVFGAATVYIFLITLIKNSGVIGGRERTLATTIAYIATMVLSAVMTVVGAVLHLKMRRKGGKPEDKLINWMNVSLTALMLFFSTSVQYFFSGLGARVSMMIVIAAAALAILYWLVRRECFVSMLVLGLSAVVFYLLYTLPNALLLWMGGWKVLEIIYAAVLVLSAAFLWLLWRKKGEISLGSLKIRFLNDRFNYLPVFIALAAVALLFVGCMILGSQYFYYAVFAAVVLLVGYGVYYILQLI